MDSDDKIRPTYVNRDKYTSFVSKVRKEKKDPVEVLEKLMVLYIKKGHILLD